MPTKRPPVFVLLGRGGAGKTESATFIQKQTGLPVIELGQHIRETHRKHPSDATANVIVEHHMPRGQYFPGGYSLHFLEQILAKSPDRFRNGFIIDGFPRREQSLAGFENFIISNGFRIGGVIELKLPSQTSKRRQQQRKREDDQTIKARESEYKKSEAKVIAAFRKYGLVQTIDMTVGGRKARIPESKKAFELSNPRFLKKKSRVIAKALKRLKNKRPLLRR